MSKSYTRGSLPPHLEGMHNKVDMNYLQTEQTQIIQTGSLRDSTPWAKASEDLTFVITGLESQIDALFSRLEGVCLCGGPDPLKEVCLRDNEEDVHSPVVQFAKDSAFKLRRLSEQLASILRDLEI